MMAVMLFKHNNLRLLVFSNKILIELMRSMPAGCMDVRILEGLIERQASNGNVPLFCYLRRYRSSSEISWWRHFPVGEAYVQCC